MTFEATQLVQSAVGIKSHDEPRLAELKTGRVAAVVVLHGPWRAVDTAVVAAAKLFGNLIARGAQRDVERFGRSGTSQSDADDR